MKKTICTLLTLGLIGCANPQPVELVSHETLFSAKYRDDNNNKIGDELEMILNKGFMSSFVWEGEFTHLAGVLIKYSKPVTEQDLDQINHLGGLFYKPEFEEQDWIYAGVPSYVVKDLTNNENVKLVIDN